MKFNTDFYYVSKNRPVLIVRGKDAKRYLQGRCTQDILKQEGPFVRQSLLLSPQGKIEGKFDFFCQGEDVFILSDEVCHDKELEVFLESLLRFKVADQVEIENLSKDFLVYSFYFKNIESLSNNYKLLSSKHIEGSFLLKVENNLSQLIMLVKPSDQETFNQELFEDTRHASEDEFLEFRIDNKIVSYSQDLRQNVSAPDVDLTYLVSSTKGCYVGQEVVEMATSRGRSNKILIKVYSDAKIEDLTNMNLYYEDKGSCGYITSYLNSQSGFKALAFVKNKDLESLNVFLDNNGQKIQLKCEI